MTNVDPTGGAASGYGVRPPSYRLPEGARLGGVRLQVASLERSLTWYQRVLGLRVVRQSAGFAALGPHGSGRPLVELRERPGAVSVPRPARLGLYHFAILLPDRASLGRFVRHLASLGERAGMADHRVSEAIYLSDPDGLGIEIYADRPRAAWEVAAGQLVMTTDPLDVEDLVAAGGSAAWDGMPAGTTMGHVHLHVGDLREAERFYHGALGFDKVVWSYPGALFLSAGGYHHHLGTNTWARGARPAGEDDARLLEWTVLLPAEGDVAAAAESLRSAGYTPSVDGDDVTVTDPWGTKLRLSADGPRGSEGGE